jgi:predicted transcriptional regulator
VEKFFFNRTKYDIIAEILMKLRVPTGRTSIILYCNMNSITSGQYLNLMVSNDLIRVDGLAGKVTYQRTEAGREFLEAYNNMVLLLDPNISPPFLV